MHREGIYGLHEQFEDLAQQKESSLIGMWAFVAQEVLFFGGAFFTYAVYRFMYPEAFSYGSSLLDVRFGAFNTVVLLLSSFTVAMAVRAAQLNDKKQLVGFLLATLFFASTFMGIKYIEYSSKYEHHLIPGINFDGSHLDFDNPEKVELFMSIYFALTGLHGLHVLVGILILLWLIPVSIKGRFTSSYYFPVEIFGLYWHFVDIVWIFLFPLLYLIGVS